MKKCPIGKSGASGPEGPHIATFGGPEWLISRFDMNVMVEPVALRWFAKLVLRAVIEALLPMSQVQFM